MTEPLDVVRSVRKLVRTGLVKDIPWLPRYEGLAEDDIYVNPEDFEKRVFDRVRTLESVYKRIVEGAEMLPGSGSILEKTLRAEKGLRWCYEQGYQVLHNFVGDLNLDIAYMSCDFETSYGSPHTKVRFLDPYQMAHRINDQNEAIPVTEPCIRDAAKAVLEKADRLYERRYSRWQGWHELPAVNFRSKEMLERIVNKPDKLLITPRAAGELIEEAQKPTAYQS